jgi:hypothetical protein
LVAIFTIDGPKASRSAGNAVNEVGALINLNTAKVLRLTVIDEKGCMSAFGPKRTCRKTQSTSLLGVKRTWRFAVDPKRTLAACSLQAPFWVVV